eukprot:COSAG01_NODE_23320_length_819_cov_3.391068_1_plen_100_part_00
MRAEAPPGRGLGAKLGERVKRELGCGVVGELAALPTARLREVFEPSVAAMLARLAHGEDVVSRPVSILGSVSMLAEIYLCHACSDDEILRVWKRPGRTP